MPKVRQARVVRWARDCGRFVRAEEAERRQIARHYFFHLARRQTPVVLADVGEFAYFVSTHDTVISRAIFKTGSFDSEAMDEILATVASDLSGKTVLDLGANLGTTTVSFVRKYGADHVIAVEPDPSTYKLLQHNILENDVGEEVTALCCAVSDHAARLPFVRDDGHWGGAQIVPCSYQGDYQMHVPASTVDDVLAQNGIRAEELGLMWMDLQGHEVHALAGASQVRVARVPIVMEFDVPALRTAGRFDDLVELVAPHYTHVIDFGPPDKVPRSEPRTLAVGDIGRLVGEYESGEFGDIAFLP